MKSPHPNPRRLSCLPEKEDSLGIGRLFRAVRELPDEDLPTLRWRLRTSQRMRAMRPRIVLRVALVAGLVFFTGGVVGAVVPQFWVKKQAVGGGPSSAPASAVKSKKLRPAPVPAVVPTPPPDVTAPETQRVPDPPKAVSGPAKHRAPVHVASLGESTPRPAPTAPAEAAPPRSPSPIALEQTLLGQAMKTLRDGHDARAALLLLAQHARQFPDGALTSEAAILRIEALLATGQRGAALQAMDRLPLASLPNSAEQLVVRGELRAADERWREAKQDFDEVLRRRPLPAATARARDLQERALWGHAAACSRLGDREEARVDLDLYLRYFPSGRFAAVAASLVKAKP